MNEILSRLLYILHISLFFIITIGPFLPGKYLIYYLFFWPGMYIHWQLNDGMCMLTDIEFKISNYFFNNINDYIFYSFNKYSTILRKFNIIFSNIDYYNKIMKQYNNILWIIVFIRALIYYRNDIVKDWVSIKKHIVSRFICDTYKG